MPTGPGQKVRGIGKTIPYPKSSCTSFPTTFTISNVRPSSQDFQRFWHSSKTFYRNKPQSFNVPLKNLRMFWYPSQTRRRNKLHNFYLAAAVWAKPLQYAAAFSPEMSLKGAEGCGYTQTNFVWNLLFKNPYFLKEPRALPRPILSKCNMNYRKSVDPSTIFCCLWKKKASFLKNRFGSYVRGFSTQANYYRLTH